MTALIDTIQQAFRNAVLDAHINGGEVRSDSVAAVIEQHVKGDADYEEVVEAAYAYARHAYGNEWSLYPGHVAELVVENLTLSDAS